MIRINLLPEGKPTKKKKGVSALGAAGRLNIFLLGGMIALGLIAILVHWWILNSELKELEEKIRKAQIEVTRLESILKEVKDFEAKKARLQKKVDLINQLKQNQKGPVRLMDEVSSAVPDLLWLERMEYKGNTINLRGLALNQSAVANFVENLRKVSSFQEPRVKDITATSGPAGASLYVFEMSFIFANLDRTQGDAPAAGSTSPSTSSPPKADASGGVWGRGGEPVHVASLPAAGR